MYYAFSGPIVADPGSAHACNFLPFLSIKLLPAYIVHKRGFSRLTDLTNNSNASYLHPDCQGGKFYLA